MRKLLSVVLVIALVLSLSVTALLGLVGCKEKKPDNTKPVYSYRMGPADLPTAWNVHTYQSNSSTYVLDYTSDSLYEFDYNDAGDGFKIVPAMASDYATDVTSEYVGQYGVQAGDVNKVWSVPLKNYLKFDNGDPITAHTFETSMKYLLNPEAANFRADNVYQSSNLKIVGAETYVKGGTYGYSEFVSANYEDDEYVDPADFTTDENGYYQIERNGFTWDVVINYTKGGNWGASFADYSSYFAIGYEMDEETGRVKIFDVNGEWILTRSTATVVLNPEDPEDEQEEDYEFYDLDGNKLAQRYVNEEGTAWVYLDKDGNIVEEWAGSKPNYEYDDNYTALVEASDEDGYAKLNAELLTIVNNMIATLHGAPSADAYATAVGDYAYQEFEEMAYLGRTFEKVDYEGNVGFFAKDDYTLIIVLINPMADNFYLRYELCSSFFLIHPATYEKNMSTSQGVYTNKYGTSVDTFVGFGPYRLTQYLADSEMVLERNPYWRGYTDTDFVKGSYQTDRVVYKVVKDDATRLEMFLKGELDSYSLKAADMKDYITSDYVYYNDTESTWYLAMNPSVSVLQTNQASATPVNAGNTVIKTPLAITEFRQALSWSLDRTQFNLELQPTSGVAKALLSAMIVADPETGVTYRETDIAKDAILAYWGLSDKWGEGKEYATRDAAIESITGYDPAGAKNLFNIAYDKAVEAGYITEDLVKSGKWEVQIVIGIPVTANFYTKGSEFLQKNWVGAVEGTKFEGHLTFVNSQELGGTAFGDYLHDGSVDILFGVGYGGSQFDPYTMMDCFTGSLQYDPFTDKNAVSLDIALDLGDGVKTYRTSLYNWVSQILLGTEVEVSIVDGDTVVGTKALQAGTSADGSLRTQILAACETKILTLSNIFPMMTDASASLRCMRVVYKTEEVITGLGRGGIRYYTYTMSDAEFAKYVANQGGTLNYK